MDWGAGLLGVLRRARERSPSTRSRARQRDRDRGPAAGAQADADRRDSRPRSRAEPVRPEALKALPRGSWTDFWTEKRSDGGREIDRPVDLETIPLHVRAGSILPFGPVKQYVDERVDDPLAVTLYAGANGTGTLYEDDGKTFNYRRDEWMKLLMTWQDATRRLSIRPAPGSRWLPATRRLVDVRIAGEKTSRRLAFEGRPIDVRL